jgi:uncharacterized protein YcfJ
MTRPQILARKAGCTDCRVRTPSGQPDYWDVEYSYRGQAFNTQLNYAPGPQIPVRVSVEPE